MVMYTVDVTTTAITSLTTNTSSVRISTTVSMSMTTNTSKSMHVRTYILAAII